MASENRSTGSRALGRALLATRPLRGTSCFAVHRLRQVPVGAELQQGVLLLSVPRRVLVRAIDRNTVRRIARETWRAIMSGSASSSGPQPSGVALLVRLKRTPPDFPLLAQRARKAHWRSELEPLFSAALRQS